ncbi:hypothetical protein [Pseudoruminococcus massiliensis]|uniref:hypothetical protein n=1 Tax=Pseudoruminococcus massiliensis TaxID=2086583 RepID=UPI0022E47D05|nr:hypothetical protein [Pseudoruminococcus massiliensis]
MLPEDQVEELAAKYAQEIVVAKMTSNSNFPIDAETGKQIADFYSEIFKGISETLKNSSFTYQN